MPITGDHDARYGHHTFASHLAMRGRTLREIQELMGHTTIKMTLRYARLSPEAKRDAVMVLDED